MTVFFSFGQLFIWSDLALRQQGFGPLLNEILPAILDTIHKDYETAAKEITAVGPEIENAMVAFEHLLLESITGDSAGAWGGCNCNTRANAIGIGPNWIATNLELLVKQDITKHGAIKVLVPKNAAIVLIWHSNVLYDLTPPFFLPWPSYIGS
jgi:hypothetical protein